MKLTIEDILRRAENDDFRGDLDNSLKAWSILKRAGVKCGDGNSCMNCMHLEIEEGDCGSYWDPPTEDEFWCKLLEEDEQADLVEAADRLGEYDPDFFGAIFCEHYSVLTVGACACCGKKIDTPRHKHTLWGSGIEESLAVCSEKCKEQIAWQTEQYYAAEAEAEAEYLANF